VPKKVCFEKNCNLCKKHGGVYTTHNTHECRRFEKDGKEKANFRTTKKDGKKGNPVNHNFMQLAEKIKKLEKVLKSPARKVRNAVTRIAIPTLNRELGWVALGN
jgi:hypothetical protein